MNEDVTYYMLPNIHVDDKSNFSKPYRIVTFPKDFPFEISKIKSFENFRGYESLKELKKNDKNWIKYNEIDSGSARKICDKRFIINSSNKIILFPTNKEFDEVSYKIVKHSLFGELKKEITGIHLFSEFLYKNITEIKQIGNTDKFGVWKAEINYFSSERNKDYIKTSTMFPLFWDANQLMLEIYYAYNARQKCESNEEIFHSRTLSGVYVDFVIKKGILKTVYPIYQEDS